MPWPHTVAIALVVTSEDLKRRLAGHFFVTSFTEIANMEVEGRT